MSDLKDLERRYKNAYESLGKAAKGLDVNEKVAGVVEGKYKAAFQKMRKARQAYDRALRAAGKAGLPKLLLPSKEKRIR